MEVKLQGHAQIYEVGGAWEKTENNIRGQHTQPNTY